MILFSWHEKEVWLIEQIRVSWNWNIETNSNARNRPELSKNKALAGSKISNLRLKENSGKSFIELTFQSLRSRQCQQKLVKRIFNPFWNYDMNEIPWYRFWDCKNKATQTGNKRCSKTHILKEYIEIFIKNFDISWNYIWKDRGQIFVKSRSVHIIPIVTSASVRIWDL